MSREITEAYGLVGRLASEEFSMPDQSTRPNAISLGRKRYPPMPTTASRRRAASTTSTSPACSSGSIPTSSRPSPW